MAIVALCFACAGVLAQQQQILARPEEQAKVSPLIAELRKADKDRTTRIATLPEAQAARDAEVALAKAREALDKAAAALPETASWKSAYAKLLDESYKIQAAHSLSSREYQPLITDDGKLAFMPFKPSAP
jgi:hypothetical protein